MKLYRDKQYCRPEIIEEGQLAAFKQLFEYVYTSIPFYRKKYQGAGVSPGDITTIDDIKNIPVLTKQEALNHQGNLNVNHRGRRFKRSTSGSTGRPLVFWKDSESMTHMDAIMYRNFSWYGIGLGDRQARFWGHPLSRIGMARTRIKDAILNRTRLSAFFLHETSYRLYLSRMERFSTQFVYGYSQSIFQFSNYFHSRGIDLSYLKIKAVILTGEMIFPHQMGVIKQVFCCPVTQEYGCTEVGVIGFGCPEGAMHLMENLLVETLPERTGKGSEVVVSELYGKTFPFIRYQLGDRGEISSENCSCNRGLKVLKNLSGRQDDFIVCPDGRLVDPYLFEYAINEMPLDYGFVDQFKIVQKEHTGLHVMLQVRGNNASITTYVSNRIRSFLPAGMHLHIDVVSELPKEISGKLRCFVSLLNDLNPEKSVCSRRQI